MLDAFDHEYIPEHMLTREFLLEIKSLLAPKGVLAANTFATSRLYDFESATYFSVFGQFYRLKRGNRVILLRQGGLPEREELGRNADRRRSEACAARRGQGMAAADVRHRIRLAAQHAHSHRPVFAVEPAEWILTRVVAMLCTGPE